MVRAMQIAVSCLVAGILFSFFIVKDLGGDSGNVLWRFDLTKTHLKHEWSMPYFSPAHCGGFHLAADAQDFIFSIYMAVSFLIPNTLFSVKLTNLLLSIILIIGIYKWLGIFNISERFVKLFGGILGAITGYWMVNITQGGHLWAHGFAYTPWILWLVEYFLETKPVLTRPYFAKLLSLMGMFFLLINSGYYWLQVAFPLILSRMFVFWFSCIHSRNMREGLQKTFAIALAGLGGIILSLARLAGVYEFQLKKFPRQGGMVGHMQVIGNNIQLMKAYIVSFFDPALTINAPRDPMMGFMWDHNNYFGVVTVIPLVLGLIALNKVIKNKAFWALVVACLFQVALTRTTHMADLERMIIPIFKQITWYWRGSGILVLFLIVLVSVGLDFFIRRGREIGHYLSLLLMIGICLDIFWVQEHQIKFTFKPESYRIYQRPSQPTDPLIYPYGTCKIGDIFGYGNENPPQISVSDGSVFDKPKRGGNEYYNLHDVRVLGSSCADGGYFLSHNWPLFPKKDKDVFERFINYHQIVPLPPYLLALNWLCLMGWVVYITLISRLIFLKFLFPQS